MADFDQLIKEKAEQAEYTYKPAAWRGFARSAGIKAGLPAWSVALISVATVALVTLVTVTLVRHTQGAGQTPDPEQTVVTMTEDTATVDSTVITDAPVTAERPATKSVAIPTHKPLADTPTTSTVAKPQKPRQVYYGRPVELNVDTITQMEPTDEQLRQGNSRIF